VHAGKVQVLQHQIALHHGHPCIETHGLTGHCRKLVAAGVPVARLVQQGGCAAIEAGHLVAADHYRPRKARGHGPGLCQRQARRTHRRGLSGVFFLVYAGRLALEWQPQAGQQGAAVSGGRGEQQGRNGRHGPD